MAIDPNCVTLPGIASPKWSRLVFQKTVRSESATSPIPPRVRDSNSATKFSRSADRRINVRNAAMAASAARFIECRCQNSRRVKTLFRIARARRCGEARGVKIIDDFGHHPTAMLRRASAAASLCRHRLWAFLNHAPIRRDGPSFNSSCRMH